MTVIAVLKRYYNREAEELEKIFSTRDKAVQYIGKQELPFMYTISEPIEVE